MAKKKKSAKKILSAAVRDLDYVLRNDGELWKLWKRVPHNSLTSHDANVVNDVLAKVRTELKQIT